MVDENLKLVDVMELSHMIVRDTGIGGADFIDISALMHMCRLKEYSCDKDVLADGEKPRHIRLQLRIYIEDLVF